jgi:perosamine synthetase
MNMSSNLLADMIPIYEPLLDAEEKRLVMEAMDSGWISSRGLFVERFEREFAQRIGLPDATSCTNGTVALDLALLGLGIGHGDEVLVPDFAYVATANAVVHVGATPVFCDVNIDNWQLDPGSVASRITSKTRAVIAVHTYGGVTPVHDLRKITDPHGLKIVEDCAEAIGSLERGLHVGAAGDVATFSFFGNKTITTGEGGMVASADAKVMQMVRRLKNQGIAEGQRYVHDLVAYNYRMTNLACAIGCAQLGKLDAILTQKKHLWNRYVTELASTPLIPQAFDEGTTSSHWLCAFRMPDFVSSLALMQHMGTCGVDTRPGFGLLSGMPMYRHLGDSADTPNSRRLADAVICLPSYPGMTADQQTTVIQGLRGYFGC